MAAELSPKADAPGLPRSLREAGREPSIAPATRAISMRRREEVSTMR